MDFLALPVFTSKSIDCNAMSKFGGVVCYWVLLIVFQLPIAVLANDVESSDLDGLIQFQISQQDARTSLNMVAKQARVQMLFDYDIVRGNTD